MKEGSGCIYWLIAKLEVLTMYGLFSKDFGPVIDVRQYYIEAINEK